MGEEEKKAIDVLENVFIFKNTQDRFTKLDLNSIHIVLNLIEKQNKRIEELEKENKHLKNLNKHQSKDIKKLVDDYLELNKDSIPKSVIKEKLEELEKEMDIFSDRLIKAIKEKDMNTFDIYNKASNDTGLKMGLLEEILGGSNE